MFKPDGSKGGGKVGSYSPENTVISVHKRGRCGSFQPLIRCSLPCRDLVDEAKKFHLRPELRSEMQGPRTQARLGRKPFCSACSGVLRHLTLRGGARFTRPSRCQRSPAGHRRVREPAVADRRGGEIRPKDPGVELSSRECGPPLTSDPSTTQSESHLFNRTSHGRGVTSPRCPSTTGST